MISEPMTMITDYALGAVSAVLGWRLYRDAREERARKCWGLAFGAGGQVPERLLGLRLHPYQLYDLMGNLALAAFIHLSIGRRAGGRSAPPGTFFCVYLAAYGLLRFFLEPLRGDGAGRLDWALTTAQWIALVHIAVAAYFLARGRRAGAPV